MLNPSASAFVRVSGGVSYDSYASGYDLLSEYGRWVGLPPYGVVWCPYVDERWAPFHDGRWIWTSYGWAWDSYEPFGELVYHYGYWYFEDDIGWFWEPGDEWSPARVQWIVYGDYCGWAPLPPPNSYWPDPWDIWDHDIWIVVYVDNFCDEHIGDYGIDQPNYRNIIQRDRVVKRAPEVKRVENVTGRQIGVQKIVRRTMDVRTDRIQLADRSLIRRDVQTRELAPATGSRVVGRKVTAPVVEKRSVPSEQRQITKPTVPTQPERQVAAPKQSAPVVRRDEAPARNEQVTSRPETPAKSDPPAQSRTAERESGRDDKAAQRDRSK